MNKNLRAAGLAAFVEAEYNHGVQVEETHARLSTTHTAGCRCFECEAVNRLRKELVRPYDVDAVPEEFLAAHIRFHLNRRKNTAKGS